MKKGVYLPAGADMASGASGELTWRAGPPHGCDAALRPRGRAAGGPREAQAAHRARTHGRRPLVSTRTPVWGATWQGVSRWRAHGLVGPGKMIGAVTRKRYTAPQFNLDLFHLSFCVGLCPTRFLPFAGDVDAWQALDAVKTVEIAWTRVHAIIR